MRFSRQAFNVHLMNIGQDVLWMRAWTCPCMNVTNGSPKPSCPVCVGRGKIWDPPVSMVMGIASQDTQMRWAKMGQWEHGDMVVVIPENCPAWDYGGQYDRFITQQGLDGFTEVLERGALTEKIRMPVHEVMRCFWIDPENPHQIVEGSLPSINDNGKPVWADGDAGAPPLGVQYSLTGDRFSEYYMLDAYPADRNEHRGMRLPKRIVLRKFDLFGRTTRTPSQGIS